MSLKALPVVGHPLCFLFQIALYGLAETWIANEMKRVRFYRAETATDLVLALGTWLKNLQPGCNAMLNALMVCRFKM